MLLEVNWQKDKQDTQSQNRVRTLLSKRWLETEEVLLMLNKVHLLEKMGYYVQTWNHSGDQPPKSGDLLIFAKASSKEGARMWRNDFLQYNSRKNSSSV